MGVAIIDLHIARGDLDGILACNTGVELHIIHFRLHDLPPPLEFTAQDNGEEV